MRTSVGIAGFVVVGGGDPVGGGAEETGGDVPLPLPQAASSIADIPAARPEILLRRNRSIPHSPSHYPLASIAERIA